MLYCCMSNVYHWNIGSSPKMYQGINWLYLLPTTCGQSCCQAPGPGPNQTKPNQTKPYQTKPYQTILNQHGKQMVIWAWLKSGQPCYFHFFVTTMVWYGWVWLGMVGYGWVWLNMVGYGWVWLGMVGYGWVWLSMVGCGWVWLGMVGLGLVREDLQDI